MILILVAGQIRSGLCFPILEIGSSQIRLGRALWLLVFLDCWVLPLAGKKQGDICLYDGLLLVTICKLQTL